MPDAKIQILWDVIKCQENSGDDPLGYAKLHTAKIFEIQVFDRRDLGLDVNTGNPILKTALHLLKAT
ncbi:MAG: hypothetical protein GY850_10225 [bacterium]|nr:hypothetical protein [bacterium]